MLPRYTMFICMLYYDYYLSVLYSGQKCENKHTYLYPNIRSYLLPTLISILMFASNS